MTQYKGILFDKDGTLLDFMATWMPGIRKAAQWVAGNDTALAERMIIASGYDPELDIITSGSLLAAGNTAEIATSWRTLLEGEPPVDLVSGMDAIFRQQGAENGVPVTDLGTLFHSLKQRGIKLGIATSDSQQGAELSLAPFGILDQLDFICGYDSGHGFKPGPGMVHAFCRHTGLNQDEVIVIGDNLHDIEMGRNAGAGLTIGVLTGTSNREQLCEDADHVLSNVAEIFDILDRTEAT
ncbi:MAG: HAD family hydrolase [Amphritea sp.]